MVNIREEIAKLCHKIDADNDFSWIGHWNELSGNARELYRQDATQILQLISQSLKPLTDKEMLQFIDRDKDRCKASECCAIMDFYIDKIRKELLDES